MNIPHDVEAEESLLGAMLLSRGATATALAAGVTSASFYNPGHGAVFDATVAVVNSGENADPVTVAAALNGDLEVIGGSARLVQIQASTPASANAPAYARIIVEHERARMAIVLADRLREAAVSGDLDPAIGADLVHLLGPPDVSDESWSQVDLRPALAGAIKRVAPTVLCREDGAGLFYRSRLNGIHGESGIGKSMLCAIAAVQELDAGHHVGWVDFEDPDPSTIVERLRQFGVSALTIEERFHYWAPRDPFTDAAVATLVAEAAGHGLTLLVIDSVGEAFGLEGLDENKDVEVGPWLRRVGRVLADAGPAVVLVDHATKAADNPLHPSGSKRKRAAITGASYLIETNEPLTRDNGGKLRVRCAKDRHGNYGRGDLTATIDMHVYPDGGISLKVWPPSATETTTNPDAEAKLTNVAHDAVRAVKTAGRPLSRRELESLMNIKAAATVKRAAIEHAVAKGAIRTEPGPRNALLHIYDHDLETTDQ